MIDIAAAFRAELLKLRRRVGVWILLFVMLAVVLLFGYVFLLVFVTQAPPGGVEGLDADAALELLRPANIHAQVLGIVAGFGSAIGLILGALATGSEYGWGTIKTMVTQRPSRLHLAIGRTLAVGLVCLTLVLVAFAGGAAGTAIVSAVEPAPSALPPANELLSSVAVGFVIVAVWCALGACLGTLFRGTAWAIGLGLLYALAIESLVNLLPMRGQLAEIVRGALIGNNVTALIAAVAPTPDNPFGGPIVDIAAGQAAVVLLGYLTVALTAATVAFMRRDIAT